MADLNNSNIAQPTKLFGANESNGADVDSDGRLLVAAKVDAEVDVYYTMERLLNGGSDNQAVNGSGTPQAFLFSPSPGEIAFVDRLNFFMNDTGTTTITEYGNISGLSNGVLIAYQSLGVLYTLFNMQNNMDITIMFGENLGLPSSGGAFLNSNDSVIGTCGFQRPITLNGDDGDFFGMQIRDNLSGLDYQKASVLAWRKTV